MSEKSYQIAVLTEAWITDNTHIPRLDNYSFIFIKSKCGKSGGIVIYFLNNLDYHIYNIENFNLENINDEFLIINFPKLRLTLICIYRHPNNNIPNFILNFEKILNSNALNNNNNILCVGDININIESNNKFPELYKEFLNRNNCKIINKEITFERGNYTSIIDHIITRNTHAELFDVNYLNHCITDHKLIVITYKHKPKITQHLERYIYNRKFLNQFHDKISKLKLDELNELDDLNERYYRFVTKIKQTHDETFPQRVNQSHYKNKWMNGPLFNMIKHKDFLYRKQKKNPNEVNENNFKMYRNLLRNKIKLRKTKYYHTLFNNKNIKDNWKNLNKLVSNKPHKTNTIGKILDINENIITEDNEIAESFAKFFSKSNNFNFNKETAYNTKINNTHDTFCINKEDIIKIFASLPNKFTKSDPDIPLFLWKTIAHNTSEFLCNLINTSYHSATFPNALKISQIIPIHKKKNTLDMNNYRPISILPNISKIFEKAILTYLNNFIELNKILPESQYGFRKNRSTIDAILNLRLKLESNYSKNMKTCLIMLDLSKAFDRVDHAKLIYKLNKLNFPIHLVNYIKSYLTNRSFYTKINKNKSNIYNTISGVPQGGILSPLLYSIYVYDLEEYLQEYIIQYADDTSIVLNYSNTEDLNKTISKCYTILQKYLVEHNLKLNLEKTEILLYNETHIKEVTFGTQVNSKTSAKFLGIHIENNMKFSINTTELTKKLKITLPTIYHIRNILPENIKKIIYYSMIHSQIIYNSTFLRCNSQNFQQLDKTHKKIIKVLFKYDIRTPTSKLYDNTKIKSLEQIIDNSFQQIINRIRDKKISLNICSFFKKSSINHNRYVLIYNNLHFNYTNELMKMLNNCH